MPAQMASGEALGLPVQARWRSVKSATFSVTSVQTAIAQHGYASSSQQ